MTTPSIQGSKKWSDLFDKQASNTVQAQDQVIATIEIHHEDQPQFQDKTHQPSQKSSEVHNEARKVAEHLYITQLDGIVKTKTRSDLVAFYETHIDQETRQNLAKLGLGFSEVLYALARGMKVVNVFRPPNKTEQEMGWHKPEEKYRSAFKESKKRLKPQADGWTGVGKAPVPEIKVPQQQSRMEKPTDKIAEASVAVAQITQPAKYQPNEADGQIDDDTIISEIKAIKGDIENHLCAIESLVPLHDEHADKITIIECNPCAVAKRIVEYHKEAKAELVQLLDTLQFELDAMKSRKVWLCEQLKN